MSKFTPKKAIVGRQASHKFVIKKKNKMELYVIQNVMMVTVVKGQFVGGIVRMIILVIVGVYIVLETIQIAQSH